MGTLTFRDVLASISVGLIAGYLAVQVDVLLGVGVGLFLLRWEWYMTTMERRRTP